MYEQHEDSSWSFAIGLFVGATLGAALASLFSPRTGQQNRETVREQGLVLKARVSNATTTAATTVKDRTDIVVARFNDTATTVKEKTSSAVETVSETASTAATKVQDAVATAKETVSETAATVKEKASSAVETVSETASSAAAKVQDVASTAAAKVQDVASTATEKARTLTQGAATTDNDEIVVTTVGELAHEASYDAEDVRPVTATAPDAASSQLAADIASVNPHPASADLPIDALSSLSDPQIVEVDVFETPVGELTSASTTANLSDDDVTAEALAELSSDDLYETPVDELTSTSATANLRGDDLTSDAATTEALAELSSTEQFEVDPSTAAGTDADVREASEGTERA